jgi:hypothetical protein
VRHPAEGDADSSLRRVERDAVVMAVAAAVAAVAIQRGRLDGALGVVAGAGLMGFSYAAIKGGVTAIVGRAAAAGGREGAGPGVSRGRLAFLAARFIGRYLLIGIAAWLVLVPLRAHPVGLFAGVTVPIAAIGLEALRLSRGPSRRGGGPAP